MVEMLIFGTRKQEVDAIKRHARDYAALLTEELWDYACYSEIDQLKGFLNQNPLLDMACVDITVEESIEQVEKLRTNNKHAYITLVASTSISPATYMRPGIMAGSLLLKPLTENQIQKVLGEAFRTFVKRFDIQEQKEQFVIDSKMGKFFVDYENICYFEAREKKIFLITKAKEIAFYDTIEDLENRLPEQFARCHRSFLVNTSCIQQIHLGQNLLILENGDELPISRSYRKKFKEFGHETTDKTGLFNQ